MPKSALCYLLDKESNFDLVFLDFCFVPVLTSCEGEEARALYFLPCLCWDENER